MFQHQSNSFHHAVATDTCNDFKPGTPLMLKIPRTPASSHAESVGHTIIKMLAPPSRPHVVEQIDINLTHAVHVSGSPHQIPVFVSERYDCDLCALLTPSGASSSSSSSSSLASSSTPLHPTDVALVMRNLTAAANGLHAAGVGMGDIKPSNTFLRLVASSSSSSNGGGGVIRDAVVGDFGSVSTLGSLRRCLSKQFVTADDKDTTVSTKKQDWFAILTTGLCMLGVWKVDELEDFPSTASLRRVVETVRAMEGEHIEAILMVAEEAFRDE